jgi:multiple sugar transport system permease protein
VSTSLIDQSELSPERAISKALTTASTPRSRAARRRRPLEPKSTVLTIIMVIVVAYFLLPIVWLAISSTKTEGDLFSTSGLAFGHTFALFDNLKRLFDYQGGVYLQWILNTLLYAVTSAVGSALICALGGYGLSRFAFKGKRVVFAVILGAVMIPGSVLAMPIFLLCSAIGVADSPWAVIIPGLASPFGLYLMAIYAERFVPPELLEAARIDGAGEVRIFFTVVVRLLAPGLVSVMLFQLAAAWNNYFLPLIVLNSTSKFPLAVGLAQLSAQAASSVNVTGAQTIYPLILTGSLVAIIPLIIAFLFLQRYWRGGLASGGVKL